MSNGERARSGTGLEDEPTNDATHDPRATPPAHDPPRTIHDPRFTPSKNEPRDTRTRTRSSHGPRSLTAGSFPHENLDAYRVALEMAALAKKLAEHIPRGHRSIADHLQRAASNTVLLLAEGANRRGMALKRQRFVESRGECGEVAAAADLLLVLGIGPHESAEKLKDLAARVSAMLTRLMARLT
jgi:four helix bundle protein